MGAVRWALRRAIQDQENPLPAGNTPLEAEGTHPHGTCGDEGGR